MTAQQWEDWTEALRYFFFAWYGMEEVPQPFWDGLRTVVSLDAGADFVYPVMDNEDERMSFIALRDDDPILIRFEPPSTTVVSYLGSLIGGIYRETYDGARDEPYRVEVTFSHPRLEDGPLVARLHVPQATERGSQEDMYVRMGQPQAQAAFMRARETLRRWATRPEPAPSST